MTRGPKIRKRTQKSKIKVDINILCEDLYKQQLNKVIVDHILTFQILRPFQGRLIIFTDKM